MSRKLSYMIFTLACVVAVGVCIIVDLAVNGWMVWSFYPMLSVPFAWLLASPFWLRRHGLLVAVCALTVFTLPYLYCMAAVTTGGGWFRPLGLPVGIIGIAAAWVTYGLLRLNRLGMWYRIAIGVLLVGAVASPLVNYFADQYAGLPPSAITIFANIFGGVIAAGVLCIIGYVRGARKKGRRG